jgi:AraC-like DNA-binding protein
VTPVRFRAGFSKPRDTQGMYEERPSAIDGSVVWRRTATSAPVSILPDGCIDVIWTTDGSLIVAGPDTHAHLLTSPPGRAYVGLRFASGLGPIVLGVPANELVDGRVRLDEIWPRSQVGRLEDHLANSNRPGGVLEALGIERLRGFEATTRVTSEIVRLLRAGGSVGSVADSVGLSERQFRRRSLEAFGYGPKTLARILRLNSAVDLARAGVGYAEVAVASGYADQAHLARDVRSLAGVTLTQLTG